MTQDELEDELFLAMLNFSRKGAGPVFDLPTICRESSFSATPQQLLAFVMDNHGTYGSKVQTTLKDIRFELSAVGVRHAKELERSRRKPTFLEHARALPIGKGAWELTKLALAALLGAWAGSYFG